mgnify:FL=1
MSDEQRLERIETKLDQMSEAIVSLARMEERMITLFNRMDAYDKRQNSMEERVSIVESTSGTNGQMLRFAERLFWIVAAGVAAMYFKG